ncbi:MAG TPA: MBL fold metallo-hydrolase [Tepidisphaeraceae bacterium]|nr:MBL fold metallo-hydrolase [Tepidisphaeraceae bacterium]
MLEWAADLKIANTDVYLDSRQTRGVCFVSHAHSDHICTHDRVICTPPTARLAGHRIGMTCSDPLDYGIDRQLDGDTRVRLLPAGHVLGSAMIHVTRPEGTLLYTGDFKLRASLTVEPAQVEPADFLVMESTYGLPMFRFPPWQETAARLVEIARAALRAGRQPVVMGYSLGKAQETARILADAGIPVTMHGAVHAMSRLYEELGVPLGAFRKYSFADFHGPSALDLAERGVLLAPPYVARTPFVTRFKDPCRVIMTGWALLKNAIYRYGVDHALPLSDHADFDELIELIDRVRPTKVFTHHGYKEFVDELRKRNIEAELARPDEQLSLFEP